MSQGKERGQPSLWRALVVGSEIHRRSASGRPTWLNSGRSRMRWGGDATPARAAPVPIVPASRRCSRESMGRFLGMKKDRHRPRWLVAVLALFRRGEQT